MSNWPRTFSNAAGSETPPIDPSEPIATTGASGSYNTSTITYASSIDPSITNLSVDRCYDTGHAAAGKLVLAIVYQGFEQPKSTISTTLRHRLASYVDPGTGQAMCVLAGDRRGRGSSSDTIDYVRDRQDGLDGIDAQAADLGALAFDAGQTVIGVGYSTGAFDLALAACSEPERFGVLVFYFGNTDLGVDPADSYWARHIGSVRTSLTNTIGDRGLGTAAALDPYEARFPYNALGRIIALPGGPEVWVLGDRDEAAGLPSPDRFAAALAAVPGVIPKLHVHITGTGDAHRILHDVSGSEGGADGNGAVYAERHWVPWALKNIAPWRMPLASPPGGFRLLGWMRSRAYTSTTDPTESRPGWEIWTGASSPPKSSATGGRLHAAELEYFDTGRHFFLDPVTSQNGYAQFIREADDRTVALTAGTKLAVNLNVAPTISTLADLGFTDAFFSDASVTGTATVTAWDAAIGAKSFPRDTVGTEPATGTDGDGETYVGFTSGNSDRLVMAGAMFVPTDDFTAVLVVSEPTTADGYFFEVSHHGDRSSLTLWTSSGSVRLSYTLANASSGLAGNIGALTMSANAKHVIDIMRKNGVMYARLDGSAWSTSAVTSDASTWTDNGTVNNKNTTSLGCGWANGGGAYWQFKSCNVYAVISKQAATSEAGLDAARSYLKTRFTF